MHWHSVTEFALLLLSSSGTVYILVLLLFLANQVNIHYLLDAHLLACTPINFDTTHKLPIRVRHLRCFDQVNGVPLTQIQWRIMFIYAQKAVVSVLLKTPLQSFRIEAVTKTQLLLHAVCRKIPRIYSANTGAESSNFWNLNWEVCRLEAGSKSIWFFPHPRYSVHSQISDPMSDLVRHYNFPVSDAFLDL
jgi:hypothetical protein